jgi:hypothetical protein
LMYTATEPWQFKVSSKSLAVTACRMTSFSTTTSECPCQTVSATSQITTQSPIVPAKFLNQAGIVDQGAITHPQQVAAHPGSLFGGLAGEPGRLSPCRGGDCGIAMTLPISTVYCGRNGKWRDCYGGW